MRRAVELFSRDALTTPAGVVAVLLYALAIVRLGNPELPGVSPVRRDATAVLGVIVLFAVLAAARRVGRGRPGPRAEPPALWLFVAVVVAVAARSVVVTLLLYGPATPPAELGWRIAASTLSFVCVLVLAGVGLAAVREHRATGRLLAESEAALASLEAALAQRSQRASDDAVRAVRNALQPLFAAFDGRDAPQVLVELEERSTATVRPLIRTLEAGVGVGDAARDEPRGAPRGEPHVGLAHRARSSGAGLRDILADAVGGAPFAPGRMTLLYVAMLAPTLFALVPPLLAAITLVSASATIVIGALVANSVLSCLGRPRWTAGRALLVTVLLVAIGLLADSAVPVALPLDDATLRWGRVSTVNIVVLGGWGFAFAAVADRQLERMRREVRTVQAEIAWRRARAAGIDWLRDGTVLRALHGPVQQAVGVAIARLRAAVETGTADAPLVAQLRGSVEDAVTSLLDAVTSGVSVGSGASVGSVVQDADVLPSLEALVATWEGISDIRVVIDPVARAALASDATAAALFDEVAVEGCWNAIRHASASAIEVRVELEGDGGGAGVGAGAGSGAGAGAGVAPGVAPGVAVLTVRSDGTAVGDAEPVRSEGMGTTMLNRVAVAWQRRTDGAGTSLTVQVPVELAGLDGWTC